MILCFGFGTYMFQGFRACSAALCIIVYVVCIILDVGFVLGVDTPLFVVVCF